VPLNVVQQWMGHSTMTMRYVHAAANTGDWIEKLACAANADPNADMAQTPHADRTNLAGS